MKILLIVLSGLLLLVIGLVVVLVATLGIVDPEGSQATNDDDPFGKPPPVGWSVSLLLVGVLAVCGGALLIWHTIKPRTVA